MYRISLGTYAQDVYYTSHKYYLSYVDLVRDCLLLERVGSHETTCNNHALSVIGTSHASRSRGFYSEVTSMTLDRHAGLSLSNARVNSSYIQVYVGTRNSYCTFNAIRYMD